MAADEEGYIVEYIAMGKSVKVTAIDPVSLKEVSIVGDAKATRQHLADLAVRKLQYVLGKRESEE